jgi:uncharacterized protein YoxC
MSAVKKLPEAVLEYFRKQGRIGGRQRAANLTPEERSEQARKAVQARWAKQIKEPISKSTKAKKGSK